jgi:hypothetical protein
MWQQQEILGVDPGGFALTGTGFLLLPTAALGWWWNRFAFGWGTVGHLVLLWLGLGGILAVAALWYNLTAGLYGGLRVWWAGQELQAVDPGRSAVAGLFMAPVGTLAASLLWALDLIPPPVPWSWLIWAVVPGLTAVFVAGTAVLYTGVVVAVSELLAARIDVESNGERARLVFVDPDRVRTVTGTLVFYWVVVLALVGVGGLWLGLVMLAGHLPAGYFGLGVGVFFGFVMALAGLVAAILMGLWARAMAALYNRWASGGGGIRLRLRVRPIDVEWRHVS